MYFYRNFRRAFCNWKGSDKNLKLQIKGFKAAHIIIIFTSLTYIAKINSTQTAKIHHIFNTGKLKIKLYKNHGLRKKCVLLT